MEQSDSHLTAKQFIPPSVPAAHLTADNDAAARQLVLATGYELADYSGGNQGICAEADNTEEGEEEEGDEIEIKMEEDVDEKGRSRRG
ncbi:hypothetical protein HO173_008628 [Letharia columbiana]|uniref:Uncharacterized protein n=1 Tax=Letharia columbiana TaxID=112416 RepID=A0A8H6FR03_9LECA|nr:uncharacterized protein HO173_008628 [Letharia columbiana]KAF6233084.1 hypothetical protein HO173_008628 [Letharia columbiana]